MSNPACADFTHGRRSSHDRDRARTRAEKISEFQRRVRRPLHTRSDPRHDARLEPVKRQRSSVAREELDVSLLEPTRPPTVAPPTWSARLHDQLMLVWPPLWIALMTVLGLSSIANLV